MLLLLSCINQSDKAKVERQNEDKFSAKTDRKEAQFLVDAVDKSYGLLEVAQLAEEKLEDPIDNGRAKQIIEHQTRVSIRLKTFAERNDVSIPFSGPEKTRRRVENLYDKSGDDFRASWANQISDMNQKLKKELSDYRQSASAPLKLLLDSTVTLLEQNAKLIDELDRQTEN